MENVKKVWTKPVLIIVGRGRSEENMDEACKKSQGASDASTASCHTIKGLCKYSGK